MAADRRQTASVGSVLSLTEDLTMIVPDPSQLALGTVPPAPVGAGHMISAPGPQAEATASGRCRNQEAQQTLSPPPTWPRIFPGL